MSYGLPDGYTRRLEPPAWNDHEHDQGAVVWQPDVYDVAADHARRRGITRLVDLGCGTAAKLLPFAEEFEVVGIDSPQTVAWLQSQRRFGPAHVARRVSEEGRRVDTFRTADVPREHPLPGQWFAADLDTDAELPVSVDEALVIASDVIEHLVHPENLLRLVAGAELVVLSTPDRERARGADDLGPPPHRFHVQEWTLAELVGWLEAEGVRVVEAGWTQSSTKGPAENTCLVAFVA